MAVRIHASALIEDNVSIGEGSSVWDNVHIRHSTQIGEECIFQGSTSVLECIGVRHSSINSFNSAVGMRGEGHAEIVTAVIYTRNRGGN